MQGTRKNIVAPGVRLWTGRLGPVLLVTYLLALVAAPASAAQSPALHRAVKAGDLAGLTRMLAAGADVNARDNRGRTALMHAVDKGYVLLVEPLLAAQADPNVRAPDGATALFIAAVHGHSEIITMLMKAGADPTIKGPKIKGLKGRTPMEVARAQYGDPLVALQQGEPPAVIALLAGKTWEEGEEFVRTLAEERQPGKSFRDCEQCPAMVVVPAGWFRMGSSAGDGHSSVRPVHEVAIEYLFAVGKYEVTFAEWDECVADGGCTHRPDDEGWGRGSRPVIHVSWDDGQAYVHWLSNKTGELYRLLSEAEWEYVARAGTTTARYWGASVAGQCEYGNVADQAARQRKTERPVAECDDGYAQTAPVGSFKANAFGLFDTAGNVWEWVEDCWNDNYNGAPDDGSAWTSGKCEWRVLRGGSWFTRPEAVDSARRVFMESGDRDDFRFGFRVARTFTS